MSERDPLRRRLPGGIGRSAAALFLAAAGCSPGIPEPSSPDSQSPGSSGVSRSGLEDCKIPAHIRGTLPEAIARATETACREPSTPTPEIKGTLPTNKDIKFEKELLSRCTPSSGDPRGEIIWGGWLVRFDGKPQWYLKSGKFEIEKYTPSGLLIKKQTISPGILLPGVLGFISAGPGYAQSGEGSQLGYVKVQPKQTDWDQLDGSDKEYKWESYLSNWGYPPRVVPRSNPRSFSVHLANNGERLIGKVNLLGILLDSNGELVDIMLGDSGGSIPYNNSRLIWARSAISLSCVKWDIDPNGYELLYWTRFNTHTGMPVARYERVKLPDWGYDGK